MRVITAVDRGRSLARAGKGNIASNIQLPSSKPLPGLNLKNFHLSPSLLGAGRGPVRSAEVINYRIDEPASHQQRLKDQVQYEGRRDSFIHQLRYGSMQSSLDPVAFSPLSHSGNSSAAV